MPESVKARFPGSYLRGSSNPGTVEPSSGNGSCDSGQFTPFSWPVLLAQKQKTGSRSSHHSSSLSFPVLLRCWSSWAYAVWTLDWERGRPLGMASSWPQKLDLAFLCVTPRLGST